ncbi:hypothetical protein [Saliphagus sp. LR7]|uniref:DUF7386 family protein n=1 Tax=Saliphagus sp. LR7 TaxID=2282654 RepID=UPI001E52DC25|nr:hypothetical protein [Saliphagus sp. LR7]
MLGIDGFAPPVCTSVYMPTKRTTFRLSDEREQLLEEASAIVADDPEDDSLMADVIDTALTHLAESEQNI